MSEDSSERLVKSSESRETFTWLGHMAKSHCKLITYHESEDTHQSEDSHEHVIAGIKRKLDPFQRSKMEN